MALAILTLIEINERIKAKKAKGEGQMLNVSSCPLPFAPSHYENRQCQGCD